VFARQAGLAWRGRGTPVVRSAASI
jgi:hypothetical protein